MSLSIEYFGGSGWIGWNFERDLSSGWIPQTSIILDKPIYQFEAIAEYGAYFDGVNYEPLEYGDQGEEVLSIVDMDIIDNNRAIIFLLMLGYSLDDACNMRSKADIRPTEYADFNKYMLPYYSGYVLNNPECFINKKLDDNCEFINKIPKTELENIDVCQQEHARLKLIYGSNENE
ncbi:hypothetical protein A134_23065 [Vibrio crassostreae 9CS106]|uniref:Uncharacterized protein n=1 Tax=Vibrio crassostreae 9CS106 TaxID=1191300 RepID=A0A1B1C3C5_9VIBR|nr:hypothetical protein A134_23065 [Vibrio crassostreae 9CS106]